METAAAATWTHYDQYSPFAHTGTMVPSDAAMNSSPTLGIMKRVFSSLWQLTDCYIKTVGKRNEVPWWGNEVSLCSLMTAAAFQASLVSLNEFSQGKLSDNGSEGKGRVDWWAADEKHEVFAEAKAIWAGPRTDWQTVSARLNDAVEQLQLYDLECPRNHGKLAVCFCRLHYTGRHNDPLNAWNDWFSNGCEPTDSAEITYLSYYVLHRNTDLFVDAPFPFDLTGQSYPGLVICCREM